MLFYSLSFCYQVQAHTAHHMRACMLNCSVMSDSVIPWTVACQAPLSMRFSSKNTGVGSHTLLPTAHCVTGLLIKRQVVWARNSDFIWKESK